MVEIIESTTENDGLEAKVEKKKEIVEIGLPIHGFVTVIKNQGKENEQILCKDQPNLLTTDGRDEFHQTMYIDTTATQTGFNFIAVTSDATAPNASDTILTGEITTGGLIRVLATTRTHTDDTNQSTIAVTFTASAIHSNVQKSGLFDLVAVGVLSHENTFTLADLEVNDTLTITWTLTLG